MSDEVTNATSHDQVEKETKVSPSVEELMTQLEQLKSTNDRLLNENKKHKAKREQAEQEKLLAEGKKDELIQQLQQKVSDYSQRERNLLILDAVSKEGAKRNCSRWDHLYQLLGGKGIEVDENSGEVVGVKEFFDKAQSDDEYSYFFNSKKFTPTENRVPTQVDNKIVQRLRKR